MKKILLSSLFAFVIGGALISCSKDSGLTNATLPMRAGGGGGTAHPALTCINQTTSGTGKNQVLLDVLEVADSDATHSANICTASSTSESFNSPSWAPGGGSICFLDYTGVYNWALKAIDVTVNSSGVAVGSNLRTIYAPAATDSVKLFTPRWSELSSTGKIVFMRLHYNASQLHVFEICTVPSTGGAVTVLTSVQGATGNYDNQLDLKMPCWSPDDSKIAASRQDTAAQVTLMIFDASTGAATDSISLHSLSLVPTTLRWSHSGANMLAFTELPSGSGQSTLYYCTPTTGATPTTNSVHSSFACWSPNNSTVLIGNSPTLQKNIPQTATVSTVSTNFGFVGPIDWMH